RETQEGSPILSKKRIDQESAWENVQKAKEEGRAVTGKIVEVVKGGLLADVGIRGFIPASLAALGFVDDLNPFVGRTVAMKVIECERQTNKLILSPKAVLKEESQKQKQAAWADLAEGQVRSGVVRRLTNFGAFIDVGGVDGLLHVSEMAWHRVNHPSDLLKEGDRLEVRVLSADPVKEKISLGLKQLLPNPWSLAVEKYPPGSVIKAKVMRTANFGAFLEVEPGVEGLVHISQLSHERQNKAEDAVKPGQIVDVKVLSVDPQAKKMSLSIRDVLPKPAPAAEAAVAEEAAPLAEDAPAAEAVAEEA
ncbi:MAG: S1 RNA-binding domain-containing protein, partial [Clostridiales bacterium]|nr:S1 RNA-binding domain-containing protein [Clostridiales bacterium]